MALGTDTLQYAPEQSECLWERTCRAVQNALAGISMVTQQGKSPHVGIVAGLLYPSC